MYLYIYFHFFFSFFLLIIFLYFFELNKNILFYLNIKYFLLTWVFTLIFILYSLYATFLVNPITEAIPFLTLNYNFFFFSFPHYYFPFIYIFLIITTITLLYAMSFNKTEVYLFTYYTLFIFLAGFGLFFTNSFLYFFFYYELLLIPSFLILYNYAKTRKCVEAAYLMFFWTQFGALFLLFNFIYLFVLTNSSYFLTWYFFSFSNPQLLLLIFFFFIGFGVKFPIWPFYDWLPKAHVEASTNFSIFLSGVLVKFAFFGFYKCLLHLYTFFNLSFLYSILFIGLVDSGLKLYYQIDLKKLIAYATVVEMHWLTLTLLNGQSILWFVTFTMLISHAFLSSNFFLIIDSITRRYKTRSILEINGLNNLLPKLYFLLLILLITFLGFPGSLFFIAEFLFFSFFLDINPLLTLTLLFLLYFFVASCYFKNWFFLLFGYSFWFSNYKVINDIDFKELLLISFLTLLVFILGFSNYLFL